MLRHLNILLKVWSILCFKKYIWEAGEFFWLCFLGLHRWPISWVNPWRPAYLSRALSAQRYTVRSSHICDSRGSTILWSTLKIWEPPKAIYVPHSLLFVYISYFQNPLEVPKSHHVLPCFSEGSLLRKLFFIIVLGHFENHPAPFHLTILFLNVADNLSSAST